MPIGLRGGYGGGGGSGLSGSVGEGAQQLVAAEGGHLSLRSSNPHWMILQFVLLISWKAQISAIIKLSIF